MANPTGYAVSFTTNPERWEEDGYVQLSTDGYTQLSTLPVNSIIKAFARSAAGVWTCTLQECWPAVTKGGSPLLQFRAEPVYTSDPGSSVLQFALLGDNIATNTTPGSGVINFEFLNDSGSKTDLPASGGFRYHIVLQRASLYL